MFGHRKSKPRRGTIAEVVSRSLEIPVDVAGGLAQVELLGNREAAIEHCQNVLEYNDDVIRLNRQADPQVYRARSIAQMHERRPGHGHGIFHVH